MKKRNSLYHGHRFPAVVISCAVRWYFRFSLSLRDIEELLLERGVVVTYETIRCRCEWNERPPPIGEDIQEVPPHSQPDGIEVPKQEDHKDLPRQTGVAIMKRTIVGVDIAKNVMQVHWVDPDSGEIVNKPVKRAAFLEYFANRRPCLVGMESCGGSQHWARRLIEMGHQVKLMPARFVKAFVTGNKNDSADARAIWMATQMPSKEVAVKTEAQQAILALHRMRQQLVKFRTMQINSLRGLLTEYGEVMGTGRPALDRAIAGVLERLSGRLPTILIDTLREQWNGLNTLDQQIAQIEHRLQVWMKEDEAARAIAAIPSVGLLTATAAVATMGHAKSFRSGREFSAWLGLVPGQTGSGGKIELLGISKRGDTYLRTLLIHGARSVIFHAKESGAWIEQLQKRRPLNVVVVALANKMARTIWAILAHQKPYEKGYVSVRPIQTVSVLR